MTRDLLSDFISIYDPQLGWHTRTKMEELFFKFLKKKLILELDALENTF